MTGQFTPNIPAECTTKRTNACAAAVSITAHGAGHYIGTMPTLLGWSSTSRTDAPWCDGVPSALPSTIDPHATRSVASPGPARCHRRASRGDPPGQLVGKGTHKEQEVITEPLTFSSCECGVLCQDDIGCRYREGA